MRENIEDWLEMMLEEESFEDILERFDLTPYEVFLMLYDNGMIDEEVIEEFL